MVLISGRYTRFYFFIILLLGILPSCTVMEASKTQLSSGNYHSRAFKNTGRVFARIHPDNIVAYPMIKTDKGATVDTSVAIVCNTISDTDKRLILTKPSFDIDIVTLPLKYRPPVGGFPNQLNTDFNAAVYLGWRNDIYNIGYKRTPLNYYDREVTHYGFSTGLFCGIGATAMNPHVTNNSISREYDGVVLTTGLAALLAMNNITCGLGVGFDRLLDHNSHYWIYQNQLWVGVLFGLNIN